MDRDERCARVADGLMNYLTFRAYGCLAVPVERYHSPGPQTFHSPIPQSVEIYSALESRIRKMVGELGWYILVQAYHPEGRYFPKGKTPPEEGVDMMVPNWSGLQKELFGTLKHKGETDAERIAYVCLNRISYLIYPKSTSVS